MQSEIANLKQTPTGAHNHALNISAFVLGQLIGAGILDEESVRVELGKAAQEIGLTANESSKTIESGIIAGKTQPRTLPEIFNSASSASVAHIAEIARQTLKLEKTDIGNADRLIALYPEILKYCHGLGWLMLFHWGSFCKN